MGALPVLHHHHAQPLARCPPSSGLGRARGSRSLGFRPPRGSAGWRLLSDNNCGGVDNNRINWRNDHQVRDLWSRTSSQQRGAAWLRTPRWGFRFRINNNNSSRNHNYNYNHNDSNNYNDNNNYNNNDHYNYDNNNHYNHNNHNNYNYNNNYNNNNHYYNNNYNNHDHNNNNYHHHSNNNHDPNNNNN